jgi:CheY-like chemotaxis protein
VLLLMLTDMGFFPREAINGKEAVAIFQQWHPDVVLMDVMMPEMDGSEATRRIKASPGGEKAAVIIVASSTMDVDEKWDAGIGADGFLRKPLRSAKLAKVMHEAAGIHFETEGRGGKKQRDGALPLQICQEPAVEIPEHCVVDLMKAVRQRSMVRLMQMVAQCAEHDREVEKVILDALRLNRSDFCRQFL